ncbi:suppressor of IKBKE 1 isoform X1 [Mycteria americana]|uniref:suppressor of IKBKE 1 isoform X1 n=1 Tax=Mycteria americana TaxID=33587 RepID=UPI003F5815E3
MTCTIEKILTDAKTLLERLKEHDTAAESLIDQSAVLHQRVAAMREAGAAWAEKGQGAAAERADPSRLRPHVLLPQENTQIRDLQQENRELWISLEEHQDALELIMSKYRKQMLQLLQGRKGEDAEPVLKVHQANSLVRWDGDRRGLKTHLPRLLLAFVQPWFPFMERLCSKIHFLKLLPLFAGIFFLYSFYSTQVVTVTTGDTEKHNPFMAQVKACSLCTRW